MTKPVKRYEFFAYIDDDVAELDCHEADDGTWINAADYARLEQECERLRDLLADWSSHFTGPKVIGGPLSSLRERTEEALLNGGRS